MEFNSVNKILERSFKDNWERPALSNYQGETLSYGEVARKIRVIHMCFEACDLRRGDKVALCSKNQANWGVSFLAALTFGAVPVPILHEFKPGNIHYLVNHSDARVLFVDEVIWEGLSESEMPNLEVIVQMNNFEFLYSRSSGLDRIRRDLGSLFDAAYPLGFHKEDIHYYEDNPNELAIINYTSGTSGFSKGVMLPFRALYANIWFAHHGAEPQMDNTSKIVSMLPSAHMYGMMFEFLFEMTIGAHVHFLTRVPSPKIILSAFQDVKPDIIIAVPLIIEKIYKTKVKPILDKTSSSMHLPLMDYIVTRKFRSELISAFGGRFEEIILGGAAFNPEVERFLHKIKFPFTVGYGMTECAPLITYTKWSEAKFGSCGQAIANCSVRIDSRNPEREPGEIQVKGENVFMGYYKNEEATKAAFTEDGWFRTGDIGIIDSDGSLFIKGRSKCMILGPSGQNIYPEELEAIINNVNYVFDSLVVEDKGGLTALIYPDFHQMEADGFARDEVQQWFQDSVKEINNELPAYSQIRKVEILPEDFERTPKRSIKRYLYQRT